MHVAQKDDELCIGQPGCLPGMYTKNFAIADDWPSFWSRRLRPNYKKGMAQS